MPADPGVIDYCTGIDVGPTVEQQSGRCQVAVLHGDMQQRSSLERETAPAGHAAIELRETLIHECGIGVNQLRQTIEPAGRVRRNEVVESRAWIGVAAQLEAMVATVRICAVIEKPFESGRMQ